jgi:hypothetical protein
VRVLFDQGTPVPLRTFLETHSVETAYERGWSTLENGELLSAAEEDGFDVFVTTDRNLKYQQNIEGRLIAIVVLSTPSWPRVERVSGSVVDAINNAAPGSFSEVSVP